MFPFTDVDQTDAVAQKLGLSTETVRTHTKRILELNPEHPFVKAANVLSEKNNKDPRLPEWVEILHDLAALADEPAARVALQVREIAGPGTEAEALGGDDGGDDAGLPAATIQAWSGTVAPAGEGAAKPAE